MDNEIKFITSLNELERLINTGFKFSNELIDCYNNSKDNLELIKLVIKENQNNLMKMIDNYNKSIEAITVDEVGKNLLKHKAEINNKIDDFKEKYKTVDQLRRDTRLKINSIKNSLQTPQDIDFNTYKNKLELMNSFKDETILNKYDINSIFLELNKNLHSKFTDITTLFNQFNADIENLQPNAITKVNAWMNEKVNSATNKDLSINIDPKIYSFNIGKASIKLSKNGIKAVLAALLINSGYNEIISPNTQIILKNIQEISGDTTDFITSKIDEYYDKIINITSKKSNDFQRN